MPQRNGQNPIRTARPFGQGGAKHDETQPVHGQHAVSAGVCASCNTAVPPKPGFRISSLKCPKCGIPLGKK
ncbi:MAG: hypothetical protein NTU66_08295 [Elusimicrobia bacterium]|nr:hypothetical protein [Elusimicrobiota bacterium]